MDKINKYYDVVTYQEEMTGMWLAYLDTDQEGTEVVPHGYGKTEEEAIRDLKEYYHV